MTDVYEKLANHLDSLPAGYPSTETGLELRILKRLFSPEEAQIATSLDHDARTGGGYCCSPGHG
jgi:electron transport complex protein RnfB